MAGRRRNPWAGFGVALVMVAVIVVGARLALRVVLEDLLARERNALVQRLTPEARDQAIRDARRLAG